MRKRLIPIDLIALLLLALALFFPWPRGLHDYKSWTMQTVVTGLCIFAMALHFVLNANSFNRPVRYFRLALDVLLFVVALLWLLNLLMGLQGMS
ncbi:MAG TPA: hypothetical protein DC054_17135 [Blastocatellia bacterium]|nr:hypothetical protein [Blastocatellia bacterium]